MKHHAQMNTHAKFGSDPPKNLRENWWQLKTRRNALTHGLTDGENPVVELYGGIFPPK